ncbi:uncharacterized protein LOC120628882 [Pararge aegeria]|uniref:Jg20269 protein n=1 Tax=Pararge aegeria aegeria TaxID=348720 RepID=A0A8S4R407_9NEOP|nr:uncharacterized protein LOC120628882 [Pararge aegeria]CAH2230060.1 jg20269 [Pararge aegeria aegeria]
MSFQGLVIVIFIITPFITSNFIQPITILSDLTNDKDIQFFKETLPWIVDNVGSDINIFYHFKDSGKNSGPRKCVLSQLAMNTYLQATFLNCEANGKPRSECIKSLPLNLRALNNCIKLKVNRFVKAADRNFRRYKINTTPALILPGRPIISNEKPEDILKGICLFYPRNKPIGCVNPKPFLPTKKPHIEKESTSEKPKPNQPEENKSTKEPLEEKEKAYPKESEGPKEETKNEDKGPSTIKESSAQRPVTPNPNEVPEEPTGQEKNQASDKNPIKQKDN